MTGSLQTDHYELTMVQASLADGTAHRRSVFEVFCRRLPKGRRYAVVAGSGRLLDELVDFRFDDTDVEFLLRTGVVDRATADWLADFRFTGSIWGYPEGEVFFPYSPILIVEGTFAEACILETWILSVLNHDCAIAGAASRMVHAAAGRPLLEMGSRRTHERAAVAAARAAYLTGFDATSNLAAGKRYGIPTRGTSAHAFTLLHDSEQAAFESQIASLGTGTTLLIDTYDTEVGAGRAVAVAGAELGGVRIDSGDLPDHAFRVRKILDDLGATGTRIVATGDLDEYSVHAYGNAPIDVYGIGTKLVTGSGAPTAELVYKLVARSSQPGPDARLEPVWKTSESKASIGGRKAAYRRLSDGVATTEMIVVNPDQHPALDPGCHRELLVPMVEQGRRVWAPTLAETRAHHAASCAELPPEALRIEHDSAAIPTVHV